MWVTRSGTYYCAVEIVFYVFFVGTLVMVLFSYVNGSISSTVIQLEWLHFSEIYHVYLSGRSLGSVYV